MSDSRTDSARGAAADDGTPDAVDATAAADDARPSSPITRFAAGARTRREVLGDAHVDRAEANLTDFDRPFRDLITEGAWGTLWADDTIPRRERSMLTLALLAATGNFDEIPMHVRATENTGASREDVMQAFLHVAVYAGVPKANHAIGLAKAVYAALDADGSDADAVAAVATDEDGSGTDAAGTDAASEADAVDGKGDPGDMGRGR